MSRATIVIQRTSDSEEATGALAAGLASVLASGDVLALEGDLGAGKTTFVRALAGALGVDTSLVSSPTFVFVNEYPIPPAARNALAGGRITHVDAYRLTSEEDLDALGWDRLFDHHSRQAATDSVALIEWPRRIAKALPDECAWIEIAAAGPSRRQITLRLPGSWESRPRLEWLRDREPTKCRVTGRWVSPTSATYPFIDERARDADMYQWFTGGYKTSREIKPTDEENV
ncbi:MAG TPA: tRNA (adenosine(37)-N6)-threonylcarbamoyltransferase complex ATPase subunit type 1 TsaE [Phycisphaerales bacterium]|nr:tRNA (adenosine(37)-N6)-threonylcarbamoyltransferase complex ATPase subunit type 1 TsaE [Phycisphaerales bacterium]